MSPTADEQALIERFSNTYRRLTSSETMMEIERAVCGCDYGCTSWTTKDEAEKVSEMLGLSPGVKFLEVGAGAGWPGLYLAKETGCDATLTDLPPEGLKAATERAEKDGLSEKCQIIQADGAALPFTDGNFDAIYHSDVLCCLVEKRVVLEECRRVAGDEAKMVFSVISIVVEIHEIHEQYKRFTTINVQITYEANMRGTSLEGRTSSPFLNSVIDLTTLEHRLLEKYKEALERIEA